MKRRRASPSASLPAAVCASVATSNSILHPFKLISAMKHDIAHPVCQCQTDLDNPRSRKYTFSKRLSPMYVVWIAMPESNQRNLGGVHMLDPEAMRNTVEWKQARPEDTALSVSVTRPTANQIPL